MVKKIIENIKAIKAGNKAILFLLSLLMTVLYAGLVIDGLEQRLIAFKEMVPLSANEVSLHLALIPSRYQLKIKHKIEKGQTKRVFFNDNELPISYASKKKVIETDYFYIEPRQVKENNILKVKFGSMFPSDIDVRLSNYIIIPKEILSYDLFILFKNNMIHKGMKVAGLLLIFLFLSCFFTASFLFLKHYTEKPFFYINLAAGPCLFFLSILMISNCLPLNVYYLAASPFFFWSLSLLTFFLILAFVAPRNLNLK